MKKLSLAISPCPNDTFMFYGLLNKIVDFNYDLETYISDIEDLNQKAMEKKFQISKLSFSAYFRLKEEYQILDSGAALGYGCGPLLVKNNNKKKLEDMKIAVPGEYTSAFMLMKLWKPQLNNIYFEQFDRIMPEVQAGKYDAGLIIHEGRFIFENYNLQKVIDLGEWWDGETGLPIPLGCIAAKRELGSGVIDELNGALKSSIVYANNNFNTVVKHIAKDTPEMPLDVIENHVKLYVNRFSIDLDHMGKRAVEKLEEMVRCQGV